VLNSVFEEQTKDAFAGFRFTQALTNSISLLLGAFLGFFAMQCITVGLLLFGIATFFILDFCVSPVDKKNRKA
jgi:hypothetical protein